MSILDIAKTCAGRLQLPQPTTFIGSTNNNDLFLLQMIYRAINEIRDSFAWPELQKEWPFLTIAGLDAYRMPADLNSILVETLWNRDQRWPLLGPLDPQEWQNIKSGYFASLPQSQYRVKGWNNNQFFINPTPSSTQLCIFEYISKSAFRPKSWVANTAYTLNTYVANDGLILKCTTAGTSSTTTPPEFGRDGTVYWQAIPAFVASVAYYVDQYVSANSKVYKVTGAGVAGAVAPSHTSGTALNGSVYFEYVTLPAQWVAGTAYVADDIVYQASGNFMICKIGGISASQTPNFKSVIPNNNQILSQTTDTITDGTAVWTLIYSAYEVFLADTDEVILDNQSIIDGAVWRFKQERGLPYQDLKIDAENQLEIMTTNLTSADTLDARARAGWNGPFMIGYPYSYPTGNFGI